MAYKITFPGLQEKYKRMFSEMELNRLQRSMVGKSEEFFQHVAILKSEKRYLDKSATPVLRNNWLKEVVSSTVNSTYTRYVRDMLSRVSVSTTSNDVRKEMRHVNSPCSYRAVSEARVMLMKTSVSRPGRRIDTPRRRENRNEFTRYAGLDRLTRFPDRYYDDDDHTEVTDISPEKAIGARRLHVSWNSYTSSDSISF